MHCPFFHICSSKKIVVKIFTLTYKKCLKNYCSTFLCSSDETILDAVCHCMVISFFKFRIRIYDFFVFSLLIGCIKNNLWISLRFCSVLYIIWVSQLFYLELKKKFKSPPPLSRRAGTVPTMWRRDCMQNSDHAGVNCIYV